MLNLILLRHFQSIIIKFVTNDEKSQELGTIAYQQPNIPDLPTTNDSCFLNNKEYIIASWKPYAHSAEQIIITYFVDAVKKEE